MTLDRTVTTTIDREICIGCGECVRVCPVGALAFKDSKKGGHSIASISGIGPNTEQGAY